MNRRDFLHKTCSALGAAALTAGLEKFSLMNALAQGSDYKALVCIFLYGGNDGNNIVAPREQNFYNIYAQHRGVLAIPREQLLSIAPTSLSTEFGFHPGFSAEVGEGAGARGLHRLWQQRKLAVVCNVGTLVEPITRAGIEAGRAWLPEQLFSHEDQQKQHQTFPGKRERFGWGGRIADRMNGHNTGNFPMMLSVAGDDLFLTGMQDEILPLILDPDAGFVLEGYDGSPEANARKQALREALLTDNENPLVAESNRLNKQVVDAEQRLNDALRDININTPFPEGFGGQLKHVAKMIAARNALGHKRQIFFCAFGGFDTHRFQYDAHAGLLSALSAAMTAFYNATVELGVANQVTTFTLSDFGRTLKPNSDGTDHGWGNHQIVMGGAVRGGDFYGRFPNLIPNGSDALSDDEGRWIPSMSVDQYAVALASWFGVPRVYLDYVAPNYRRFDLPPGFMQ